MDTLSDALDDLAALLTAKGVPATRDPRSLQRPGALLRITKLESGNARALAEVSVTGVHPGPEAAAADAWLWDTFAHATASVGGALTFEATTYADLPAVRAVLTLEVDPWP